MIVVWLKNRPADVEPEIAEPLAPELRQLPAAEVPAVNFTDVTAEGSPISTDPLIGLESEVVTDERGQITAASNLTGNAYIDARGGEKLFEETLQSVLQILPEEPLAPGVTWTNEMSTTFSQQGLNLTREISETYTCTELTTYNDVPAFAVEVSSEAPAPSVRSSTKMEFVFLSLSGSIVIATPP